MPKKPEPFIPREASKPAEIQSLQGNVEVRLWTDIPGLPPTILIDCPCSGSFKRMKIKPDVLDAEWKCDKCSRSIHIRER